MGTATLERSTVAQQSTVPEWMRLSRVGAVVMVVFAAGLQLVARSVIPPVAVIGLVFLISAPFLRGPRRGLGLALAIFAALAFLGNVPYIVDDLRHPETPSTFVLQLAAIAGVAFAVAGGIGAFFARPVRWIRPLMLAAAGAFIAGSLTSVAVAAGTDSVAALPDDFRLTAQQVMWGPDDIVLDESATGIWIDNRDGVHHTFAIPELGIEVGVPGFKSTRVDIDAAPGKYEVVCTVPGHETMTATLTIAG